MIRRPSIRPSHEQLRAREQPAAVAAKERQVQIVQEPDRVAAVLPAVRRRILEALGEPDSAAGVARQLDLPRQKVNYHLRELEREGFVQLHRKRKRRGCVERLLRTTARAFVIDPGLLGRLGPETAPVGDRLSSGYLVASSARTIHEVSVLRERSRRVGKRLATLTLETELAFSSPVELLAFTEELARTVTRLSERHHGAGAPGSRRYRLMVGAHPSLTKTEEEAAAEEREHSRRKRKERKR